MGYTVGEKSLEVSNHLRYSDIKKKRIKMLTISPGIQPMYIASIGEFEIQMVLGSRKVKLTYDDMNI